VTVWAIEPLTIRRYFLPDIELFFTLGSAPDVPVLTVGYPEQTPTDKLRVEWDISMTRTSSADQATFRIYNLNEATRRGLHGVWRKASTSKTNSMVVRAGLSWEGQTRNVFRGQIWKMNPSMHSATDVVTEVHAGDGAVSLRDSTTDTGATFAKVDFVSIIQTVVTLEMGLPIDAPSLQLMKEAAAQLPQTLDWSNYTISGDLQDVIDDLVATLGLEWKIYRGYFIVLRRGIRGITDDPLAPLISADSGLIDYRPIDDDGIELTALANPRVAPGIQIAVQGPDGLPVGALRYRVSTVRYHGSNYGESLMSVVGRKADLLPAV